MLVKPQAVLATDKSRLEVEQVARQAAVERERTALGAAGTGDLALRRGLVVNRAATDAKTRRAAVKQVDETLVKAGLIDGRTGAVSDKIVAELSWEREELLPTPGVLVRGCLDECNTCEDALRQKVALELERKALENKLLERQIQLLDQAREYRCCPVGESEGDDA